VWAFDQILEVNGKALIPAKINGKWVCHILMQKVDSWPFEASLNLPFASH